MSPLIVCVNNRLRTVADKHRIIKKLYFSLKKLLGWFELNPRANSDKSKQIADKTPNKPLKVIKPKGSTSKEIMNKLKIELLGLVRRMTLTYIINYS
jgi:hypothetical protein